MANKSFRETMNGQRAVIQLLKELDFDLRTWEILLLIGAYESEGTMALAKRSGISKSSVSRHICFLSGTHPDKSGAGKKETSEPAHDHPAWVEVRIDPSDVRYTNLYLTDEGRKLIEKVQSLIEG